MGKVIVPQSLYDHIKALYHAGHPEAERWLQVVEPNKPIPAARAAEELTLKDFGWAPGGYTFKCVDCPPNIGFMENGTAAKRAWRCEKHAQERLDEARRNAKSAPDAGAPKTDVEG